MKAPGPPMIAGTGLARSRIFSGMGQAVGEYWVYWAMWRHIGGHAP
ncbi:MAG: hypothetical protein LAT78_10710 [Roseinatronobacter sp.]|nr:hypothetical protein [Roseinatronobacter sp.]